jgi:hypothetical protein
MKLKLTTPKVENKTTDTVRVSEIVLNQLLQPSGPRATVEISEGEDSGAYKEHQIQKFTLHKSTLAARLDAVTNGTDTVREALEKAILLALQDAGELSDGTVS